YNAGLTALTHDNVGNLYVYDGGNGALRKIARNGPSWTVSTLKSFVDASRKSVKLGRIWALASDKGLNLYAESGFSVVKLTPDGDNWIVSTLAGSQTETGFKDGIWEQARFGQLGGIAIDESGSVFVSETYYNVIRKISSDGYVTTIGGLQQSDG